VVVRPSGRQDENRPPFPRAGDRVETAALPLEELLRPCVCALTLQTSVMVCSNSCEQASSLAVKDRASEIDALVLNSVSERHDRVVLTGYAESWRAGHKGASVTFIGA
jgi:hypothetical protein